MIPVNKAVNVNIQTSPIFPARRGFGLLLILGISSILPTHERSREYSDIDEVAADFGTNAEEYKAALAFFQQNPNPRVVRIGRRFATAVPGQNYGSTSATKVLATWQAVLDGKFKIVIDNVAIKTVGPIDFSAAASLNAVAALIQTAVRAADVSASFTAATVVWDGTRFIIKSGTTGAASQVSYLTAPGSGTDIGAMLGGTQLAGAIITPGSAIEDLPTALQAQQDYNTEWYGVVHTNGISDAEIQDMANWVEARVKVAGYTTSNPAAIDATSTTDVGYLLKAAGLRRTIGMYDPDDAYAICSAMARAFSVNFNENNSVITLKFKTLPGQTTTDLTTTQKSTLDGKNLNYYTQFGDSAMFAEGVTASGIFFDEVHGLDWFQNAIETNVFGFLYTRTTKVPQTDRGMQLIEQQIVKACASAVNNGLAAPGMWTGDEFGDLKTDTYLPTGYYVYANPIDTQNQSDREARIAPPFQVALKGAGAIHHVDVTVNFNR